MRIDMAMERLLDDWGWWARERQSSGYRCRSMEGRYRPERVPDADQAPRSVDEDACLRVERTVCHTGFPSLARILLKGWYVSRIGGPRIAAMAGIPKATFEAELFRAVTILRNRMKIFIDMDARMTTMPHNESNRL